MSQQKKIYEDFILNYGCAKPLRDFITNDTLVIREWISIQHSFNLSTTDTEIITSFLNRNEVDKAILITLEKWIHSKGSEATFDNFVRIFMKRGLKNVAGKLERCVEEFRECAKEQSEKRLELEKKWPKRTHFEISQRSIEQILSIIKKHPVILRKWGTIKDDFVDNHIAAITIDSTLSDLQLEVAIRNTLLEWIRKSPRYYDLLIIWQKNDAISIRDEFMNTENVKKFRGLECLAEEKQEGSDNELSTENNSQVPMESQNEISTNSTLVRPIAVERFVRSLSEEEEDEDNLLR